MSTNLEYRARKSLRPAKLNEKKGDRDLEREIKKEMRHFFLLEGQHENFIAAVIKWEMLAVTNARWKWVVVKKKVNISSKQRVTSKKFLEVSRCSRGKQRQSNEQKRCAARAKLLFLPIRTIGVFHRSPALPPSLKVTTTILSATQRCNIVSNNYNIVPTLQRYVALKIVVANRPM